MPIDDDDFEDDDDDFGPSPFRLVESKPITKYTFIKAACNLVNGVLSAVLETSVELTDAIIGAEGYAKHQKNFADQARVAIESIVSGDAEDTE